jgi:hypothetical protein
MPPIPTAQTIELDYTPRRMLPQVGPLLHWIACQAAEAKAWLEKNPLPLLHQLSHDGHGIVRATSAVTTRQCCQLLAGMLLGCFMRGRRSLVSAFQLTRASVFVLGDFRQLGNGALQFAHHDADSWPSTSFAALSSTQVVPFFQRIKWFC